MTAENDIDRFMLIFGIVLTCAIVTFIAPIPAIIFMCIKSNRVCVSAANNV